MKVELLSRLFGSSPAAAIFSSQSGAFLAANRNGEALVASLSLEARNGVSFHSNPLEQILRDSEDYMRLISGETDKAAFALAVQNPRGPARWLVIDAWSLDELETAKSEENDPRFVLIVRDETKQRQKEIRLQDARRSAEQAAEVQSQFLANMSHEIRTPIQTIMGMTELFQNTKMTREQSEYSRQIKFSADVLLSLINDILDYSKIEAGRMDLEHIDFDLEQIIEQTVEMVSLEAHRKGLEIALDIPPDTAIVIRGDPGKYRQILLNLIKNAVKFTTEGGITVATAFTGLYGRDAVRVSVTDTGIGVPAEIQDRLFTSFFQGDPSNTRQFGGTGLGLAISKNLVDLMGGVIEMLPNEGGGSIFRFTIPIERSGKSSRAEQAIPGPRDLRILVADDRTESRSILTTYLRDAGYFEVSEAVSGEETLTVMRVAAARKRPFGLCFLDMTMPRMDGLRLAEEINSDEEINSSRLILMVPRGLLAADAKMALLKRFNAYINKPIKRRDLARTMAEALTVSIEDQKALEEQETAGDAETVGLEEDSAIGEKPLILIVEDHPVNQKVFALILAKLGYPVVLADDGIEALEKIAAYPAALIFMDIQMPRMNGYEAAIRLRRQGFDKPVIAVTAGALSDEMEHCLSAGFDDILIKPFRRPDIEKALKTWLPHSPPQAFADAKTHSPLEPVELEAPPYPIFNRVKITETFMDNENMIRSFLIRFIEKTREQIAAGIPRSMETADWEAARREAHSIKGSALTMGAGELGRTAARLEEAFKNIDKTEINAAHPLLADTFIRFEEEVKRYLSETAGRGSAKPPESPVVINPAEDIKSFTANEKAGF
jgi:signal transduction histidine kinase/CheY-like chemotaxis protein/HPt (histidine-containing phosphotransfer) domain-containing protein